MLSFQRLHAYQRSVEFAAVSTSIIAAVPRGYAGLSDQLRRAAFSVPLNIAEASGRPSAADAARHYAIARGSAMECAAALDVLRILALIRPEMYEAGLTQLAAIVAMLTRLCRR